MYDWEDESDEYDEEETYAGGEDEELSEEDKLQMEKGTRKVREVLGPDVSISDKDIHASLWHYYYDIDKTVDYILSQYLASFGEVRMLMIIGQIAAAETKQAKQAAQKANKGKLGSILSCHEIKVYCLCYLFKFSIAASPSPFQSAQSHWSPFHKD